MTDLIQKSFQEHLGGFLFALFFSVIAFFFAKRLKFFKNLHFQSKSFRVTLKNLLVAFLIYFGVMTLAAFVFSFILALLASANILITKEALTEKDAVQSWVTIFAMTFVALSLIVYLRKLPNETKKNIFGDRKRLLKNIGMGILALIVAYPCILAMTQLSNLALILLNKAPQEQVAVVLIKSIMDYPIAYFSTLFFVAIIIPVIEEILFRGFLQNFLANYFTPVKSILLTSIIFACFHFSTKQGWGNLIIIPSLFILACFTGYTYFRQKSLLSPIALHATYNAFNVLLMTFVYGN